MTWKTIVGVAMACALVGCPNDRPDDWDALPASCQAACANDVECGGTDVYELRDCVRDCEEEPWPQHFRDCRATTCSLSERECADLLDPLAQLGEPCTGHLDCRSGLCLMDETSYCSEPCTGDCSCAHGFNCVTTASGGVCAIGYNAC